MFSGHHNAAEKPLGHAPRNRRLMPKSAAVAALLLLMVLFSCAGGKSDSEAYTPVADDTATFDTLRVGTLYGPTSYFTYRDVEMGFDYTLAKDLGKAKGWHVQFTVGTSVNSLIELLDSGRIDLIAYDVPLIADYSATLAPCGIEHISEQVLVQRKGAEKVNDVVELVGKEVFVEAGSKYEQRLRNMNNELGGDVIVTLIDYDSAMVAEDIFKKVVDKEIDFTVTDSDIARRSASYFPGLDFSVSISFPQRSSWVVSRNMQWLADSINAWFSTEEPKAENERLLRRYFELSRTQPFDSKSFTKNFNKGYISDYDSLFRINADRIDGDWRLLASMCYAESKFDNSVVSWAGARGIMQIMPGTARAFGVSVDGLKNPSVNVEVATKIIDALDKSLAKDVPDAAERLKFIVAAYNSGIAHVKDAISIARAKGLNAQIWDGNVAEAMKMKALPEIYNDKSICRYGYFKGTYTTAYVRNVMDLYSKAKEKFA